MKNVLSLPVILALALFCSCQKQETEADRNAEVEKKVQERLAAERQATEQQQLSQAQVDLDQRVKDLENRGAATPEPQTQTAEREPEQEQESRARTSGAHRMPDEDRGTPTASYSTFYTRLEPQGEWRETSNYGYVWQPRVAAQSRTWRPYTNGHWVYTDAGWTWISEEPFGWATYHYGRWTRLRGIGWVWVPGDEWAPAWVSWRKSNDYVGWAPLPPEARFERSSGIHNWADNYYDIGPDQYCFVATNNFGDERVERALLPNERNVTIINETTNVTNITYTNTTIVNQGPNYDEIRVRTARPIERLRLERQVNVNFDSSDPRAVVKGQVVEMPGPVIARAQRVERPRNVREIMAQVTVDHGWEGIADRQAADKARNKMRSEATPPPNAPSRTFVKPAEVTTATGATTATAVPAASTAATATVAPSATVAPTTAPGATPPSGRRTSPPVPRPMVTPSASVTATPAASATPRPLVSPSASATATATPQPRASVAASATAAPVNSPTPHVTRTMPAASVPPRVAPSVAPEPSATPVTAATAPAQFPRHSGEAKEQRKEERQQRREERAPGSPWESAAPTGSMTPFSRSFSAAPASTAPSSATSSPSLNRHEMRKEEKRARRAGESETPTPTPSSQ
jgi:hypothetical protein